MQQEVYRQSYFRVCIRLVLKCGLAHLNANTRDESNASANAQQLNQMQMHLDQMHLDQIQMHLDQMQMVFYNYVFCVHKWYFAKLDTLPAVVNMERCYGRSNTEKESLKELTLP